MVICFGILRYPLRTCYNAIIRISAHPTPASSNCANRMLLRVYGFCETSWATNDSHSILDTIEAQGVTPFNRLWAKLRTQNRLLRVTNHHQRVYESLRSLGEQMMSLDLFSVVWNTNSHVHNSSLGTVGPDLSCMSFP